MERWKGKYALVTGAAMGIGAAISSALIENGVNVIGCGRNEFRLKAYARSCPGPGQFIPIRCDIAQEMEISHMIQVIKQKFGTVHILINNAGMNTGASLIDGKTDDWGIVMDINVIGTCTVTREVIQLMRESNIRSGYIINVSAVQSNVVTPVASMHMYTASKHALQAITHGLRLELKEERLPIKATMLSPSVTDKRSSFVSKSPEDKGKQKEDDMDDPMHAEDIADNVIRVLSQADWGREMGDIQFTPTPKKSLTRRSMEKKANDEEAERIRTEVIQRLSRSYAEDLSEIGDLVFVASPTSKSAQNLIADLGASPSRQHQHQNNHNHHPNQNNYQNNHHPPNQNHHQVQWKGSKKSTGEPPVESAL